jgi:hypothetical protein
MRPEWLKNVDLMMHRYFKDDKRISVKLEVRLSVCVCLLGSMMLVCLTVCLPPYPRMQALVVLEEVFDACRHLYDEDVVRGPVLRYLGTLYDEPPEVQERAFALLVKVLLLPCTVPADGTA